jgi:hypothetical protein
MLLSDIIIDSCKEILPEQKSDGSFPPGFNGPYQDTETPARNTAHWLILLLKAYELTRNSDLKKAAVKAADFLISPIARPMNAAFFCRTNPKKDFCNGLIGQAWVIEALIIATDLLKKVKYKNTAMDVFLLHPFNDELGLWQRLNVDGSYATIDMTFNHQLWFAAVGAMLAKDQSCKIRNQIVCFLDKVDNANLKVSRSGRIIHAITIPSVFNRIIKTIKTILYPARVWTEKQKMRHKENGYQAFNLYAFSMLNQSIPDHILWKNKSFKSAVNYINNPDFINSLEKNEFAYPYNPVGFEIAFTLETFSILFPFLHESPEWWVNKQLGYCFDKNTKLMDKNTIDRRTLASRLYEATRLSNMIIELTDNGG